MLSRVRGVLSSLWPSRHRRAVQERRLRSSSSSPSTSRSSTRSSSVESGLVDTTAVVSGEINNFPVTTSAEAAATAVAYPTIVQSIEFTLEPYTSTVNTPVTTSAGAAATAVANTPAPESVEFTAQTNPATGKLVDTNTAEPIEAWPSVVASVETANNLTNPAATTFTDTAQAKSGAAGDTSTPQIDQAERDKRAIAQNTLEEPQRPANIERRQTKNALWMRHRNMTFSRFNQNHPSASGKNKSPDKVRKIKSEPKTPSERARIQQRRFLASIDATYYPSSTDEETTDEEPEQPKSVASSTSTVDRPKLKWPKRKRTISEINTNESTLTAPRKRQRISHTSHPPPRYPGWPTLSPVDEETDNAVKVAIAARYSPCDVDSEPQNSSPSKYRGLSSFQEHLTGGESRSYSEPPEEPSFISDEMDIDGPSYGESIPHVDEDGFLVFLRPEHASPSQNAHHDQSNSTAHVDNAHGHTHHHNLHNGQAQVDNAHLHNSPLDNAQPDNTHPLATPFIKKTSKSPHGDHDYTPPDAGQNTTNEQSTEDESDLEFMIPKAEKDGIAFEFSAERARRWANAVELPDDSWSESEKDLYLRLAMRGFEPLLPAHWQFDFGTLPESLFGEPGDGGEPFFTPSGSSEFHAIKSLASLLSLGGRVRDCGVLNARPETVIKRGIRSYLRWAVQDGGLRATPASIPVHAVYCQRQGECTLSAVRRLDRRLGGLAGRYSGTPCPLLTGFLVCGPIVVVLTYDPNSVGAAGSQDTASKFLCQVDLSDRGQDVWNSLALAVAVINVRGQMAGLAARRESGYGEGAEVKKEEEEEEEDEDL